MLGKILVWFHSSIQSFLANIVWQIPQVAVAPGMFGDMLSMSIYFVLVIVMLKVR